MLRSVGMRHCDVCTGWMWFSSLDLAAVLTIPCCRSLAAHRIWIPYHTCFGSRNCTNPTKGHRNRTQSQLYLGWNLRTSRVRRQTKLQSAQPNTFCTAKWKWCLLCLEFQYKRLPTCQLVWWTKRLCWPRETVNNAPSMWLGTRKLL